MTLSTATESALRAVSFFEPLRPDELSRVARRFELKTLEAGQTLQLDTDFQRLVVVVTGRTRLDVERHGRTASAVLEAGDRHGELSLLSRVVAPATVTALRKSELALLDRAGLDGLLVEFPVVGLPLADELAREVAFTNDVVRQLLEVWAEGLSVDQHTQALETRRDALERRGARVTGPTVRALFRRTVVERGAEPPFWATVGFLLSLTLARAVVAAILAFHLEKQLFALVPGNDPNPMHVHHFNYGLVLIGVAGVSSLFPLGRKALRALAFVFGLGAGLVFDEFALFWNLNPEYSQALSLYAAAMVLLALINLTWFRAFWVAVARRLWRARSSR